MASGGFWNRAGRRSGGNRPIRMDVPRYTGPVVSCLTCHNTTLPAFVTSGCRMCSLIVALLNAVDDRDDTRTQNTMASIEAIVFGGVQRIIDQLPT